jgi:hypothetical protein
MRNQDNSLNSPSSFSFSTSSGTSTSARSWSRKHRVGSWRCVPWLDYLELDSEVENDVSYVSDHSSAKRDTLVGQTVASQDRQDSPNGGREPMHESESLASVTPEVAISVRLEEPEVPPSYKNSHDLDSDQDCGNFRLRSILPTMNPNWISIQGNIV